MLGETHKPSSGNSGELGNLGSKEARETGKMKSTGVRVDPLGNP